MLPSGDDPMVATQAPLPAEIAVLSAAEVDDRLGEAKRTLGTSTLILGHHYQQDDVIKFADYTGDSLKLSQLAAGRRECAYLVFCGVHFMTESADILSAPHQQVILPDLSAGCSMADMAHLDEVEHCWRILSEHIAETIIPITYVNSAATLKAFCGRNGGAVCTSSNADKVLRWALEQGQRVLFFPDQHLGRNTGLKLGFGHDQMALWSPDRDGVEPDVEALQRATLVLWDGYCSVHQMFTVDHVRTMRASDPTVRVIVHPECPYQVVEAADEAGSTEYLIRRVQESAPGSKWAVGTEINLVHRLAGQHPDKEIVSLSPNVCVCSTMYRIDPHHLLWVLESLVRGEVVNRIVVPPEDKEWALVALNRMLEIA